MEVEVSVVSVSEWRIHRAESLRNREGLLVGETKTGWRETERKWLA